MTPDVWRAWVEALLTARAQDEVAQIAATWVSTETIQQILADGDLDSSAVVALRKALELKRGGES